MPSDSRGSNGRRSNTTDDQNLTRLLCRALSRLAVAAQGVDGRLDAMLGDLRQILRRDIEDPEQLSELIDAIDARIKLVDDKRDQLGDLLQISTQRLIEQLLAARPASGVTRDLKTLQKEFKQQHAEGEALKLLARLPALQAQVLDNTDGTAAHHGLFARLFGRAASPQKNRAASAARHNAVDDDAKDIAADTSMATAATSEIQKKKTEPVVTAEAIEAVNSSGDTEPPFARISTAVCEVLDEILRQIDPPPSASDNYRHACAQIAKGLNWYELVSTLEEVGVIVLAALERGQGELQEFLLGISKRLEEAHHVLDASRQNQTQRRSDDDTLNTTVRSEVQQMQQQVAAATQLDVLKTAIGTRLDTIVGALDQHRTTSAQRQHELEQQLGTLTERLRDMEAQATVVEKRMVEEQRLALLDTLTQLPNRKAYEQRVADESERSRRYARPLTLAVCDLDCFKSINDSFGHLAGDKVLRIIAKTLRTRLRKSDFIARFGGEEFVILLPETDGDEALRALETIREAVAQCPFHFRDSPVAVTVSIGIATFSADASPESVFERADKAMYQAKESGRNRCVVAAD